MKEFIENFAAQFEETPSSAFHSDTKFRNLDEWSSLTALSVIAMVDEAYAVKIKGEDIRAANTIGELFEIVKSRM